jgi:hypothetical protein
MADQSQIANIISAVAALGTASVGLVDATKAFWGGASRRGFGKIRSAIQPVFGPHASDKDKSTPLAFGAILDTLLANWMNGTALNDQKAIAKSLLKLRLNADNSAQYAAATGIDPDVLNGIAGKLIAGTSLSTAEADAFGRFDLILTALLDEGYQRADQMYRNFAKLLAGVFAVAIAVFGGYQLHSGVPYLGVTASGAAGYWGSPEMWTAVIVGLLATPLAPVAKDLTSALAAGVKAVQSVKK